MSLEITLSPTLDGMRRALNYSTTGIKVDAKYIGVGEGLQEIVLDGAKRAVTNRLKKSVAWLEILTSVRIDDYQHQMIVDLKGIRPTEWNFAECCLADEDKNVIAIYGNPTQALMTVSPVIDRNFLAINMALKSMAAGSINIIHQGIPIELLAAPDWASLFNSMGMLSLATMRQQLELMAQTSALETLRQEQATLWADMKQNLLAKEIQQAAEWAYQQQFNASVFNNVSTLSLIAMQQKQAMDANVTLFNDQLAEQASAQEIFNAGVFMGFAALARTAITQQYGVVNNDTKY